jgi:HEAT repeat protein
MALGSADREALLSAFGPGKSPRVEIVLAGLIGGAEMVAPLLDCYNALVDVQKRRREDEWEWQTFDEYMQDYCLNALTHIANRLNSPDVWVQFFEGIIPRLREMLQHDSPIFRTKAVVRLGIFHRPEVVDLLIGTLADSDQSVSLAAVKSLAQIGDDRATMPLLDVMQDSGSKAEIAGAIASSGPHITSVMLDTLDSDQAARRAAAAIVLGVIKDDGTVKPLLDLLNRDENTSVRTAVIRALGHISDARAVDPLLDLLFQPGMDGMVRLAITIELSVNLSEWALDPLLDLVHGPDSDKRHTALGILSPARDPRCYDAFINVLQTDASDANVSLAALKLGQSGDIQALDRLLRDVEALSGHQKESAILALGRIRDDRAFNALVRLLDNPDPRSRSSAVAGLRDSGDPRAVSHLRAMLADSDQQVQSTARSALKRLGSDPDQE